MAARDIAKLQGGPRDGDTTALPITHNRLRWPDVEGSYVFVGVDPKYRHLKYYRWEPE